MSSYGWRDIGLGPRYRKKEINAIIGNFTNNDTVKTVEDIEKEYCSDYHCKLVFSVKINKWVCPDHGCNLTKEENDILMGKDPPSPPVSPSPPPITATTAFEEQANSLLDDLEPGIGGGFIPMQRAGNTDVISRQEGGIASGVIIPVGPDPRKDRSMLGRRPGEKKPIGNDNTMYMTPGGDLITLDADRRKMLDEGKTILSAEDIIPEEGTTSGPNQFEITTTNELRRRKEEDQLYDQRYEGRSEPYPEDSDNFSESGLKT